MRNRKNKKRGGDARIVRRLPPSISNFVCVAAGALLVALLQVICEFPHKRPVPRELGSNMAPGPWGRLELTPLRLEKPPEMLPDAGAQIAATRWHFAGRTKAETIAFLTACDLTPAQRDVLSASNVLSEKPDGCWLEPSVETVLSLLPASRERLYSELEKSSHNVAQRHPFRIRPADGDIWFTRVGLPEDKVRLAKSLVYRRGEALCFSDTAVAKSCLAPQEFTALLRALYSSDTVLLKLRLETNDPIDRIAAYWGKGGREESLKSFLKAAARTPGGMHIDAESLLPPLPRTWLYTYPGRPSNAPSAGDCYWTSLNFFRTAAEDRFLDPDSRAREIRENYQLVARPERLGDVIVFANAGGTTEHACVYLAADIVFTKNGAQNSHPWVLMRLDQVRAIYSEAGGQMLVFRLHGS